MKEELSTLTEQLQSTDSSTRRYAAEDLADYENNESVDALAAALIDDDIGVQEAVAEALLTIGTEYTITTSIELLRTENARVRNYALEILKSRGGKFLNHITPLLDDPDADIRKFALEIIGEIGAIQPHDSFGKLIQLLDDDNINVATEATYALGRIGDPACIPALQDHLTSNSWMQIHILEALRIIGGNSAQDALRKIDISILSDEAIFFLKQIFHDDHDDEEEV